MDKCFWRHQWNPWTQYQETMTVRPVVGGVPGEPLNVITSFQSRTCARCGFMRVKEIDHPLPPRQP